MTPLMLIAVLFGVDPSPKPPFKAGQVRDDNGLEMKLVWCPPGKQQSGFWIGKYEVTQKQWVAVMDSKPWEEGYKFKADPSEELPAVGMYAEESSEFVKKLNASEKAAKRLPPGLEYAIPTQAEWEYACRAGSKSDYCYGNDIGEMNHYAWWGAHSANQKTGVRLGAHGVGDKLPNKWGLHDVHGNARELCVAGSGRNAKYVACGGSWADREEFMKCSHTEQFMAVKGSVKQEEGRGRAQRVGLRIVLTRSRRK